MKKISFIFVLCLFNHGAHATDLLQALQAARQYDTVFLSSIHARQADKEKREQGKSLLLPKLNLGASYSHLWDAAEYGGTALQDYNKDGNNYGYQLSLSMPVYDAQASASADQTGYQADLVELVYSQAEQDLILRVARAYFDYAIAQEKLTSVLANKKSVEEQLKITKKSFDLGFVTINDYYEAMASFDKILSDEIYAQNDIKIASNAFRKITGLSASDLRSLSEQMVPEKLAQDSQAYWKEIAYKNNQSIRIQKYQLEIASREIDKHRLKASPKLELYADYSQYWDDQDISLSGGDDKLESRVVGLRMSIPLYSGGNRSSRLRETVEREFFHKERLESAYREVDQSTYQAVLNLNASVANYFALEQLVQSTYKLLDASKVSRKAGLRTTADVLRADQQWHAAKFAVSAARYNYLYNKLVLESIVGGLNRDDVAAINGLFLASR